MPLPSVLESELTLRRRRNDRNPRAERSLHPHDQAQPVRSPAFCDLAELTLASLSASTPTSSRSCTRSSTAMSCTSGTVPASSVSSRCSWDLREYNLLSEKLRRFSTPLALQAPSVRACRRVHQASCSPLPLRAPSRHRDRHSFHLQPAQAPPGLHDDDPSPDRRRRQWSVRALLLFTDKQLMP